MCPSFPIVYTISLCNETRKLKSAVSDVSISLSSISSTVYGKYESAHHVNLQSYSQFMCATVTLRRALRGTTNHIQRYGYALNRSICNCLSRLMHHHAVYSLLVMESD